MDITVNGRLRSVAPEWRDEALLSVLREQFGLVGAKFGCGVGICGACTVIIDGEAVRSCIVSVRDAAGRTVLTIEGLARADALHPVQQAWLDEAVSQCGYCQTGQIMSAVALLERSGTPSDSDITAAMNGNLCRCGTYTRVRRAIHRAAGAER